MTNPTTLPAVPESKTIVDRFLIDPVFNTAENLVGEVAKLPVKAIRWGVRSLLNVALEIIRIPVNMLP